MDGMVIVLIISVTAFVILGIGLIFRTKKWKNEATKAACKFLDLPSESSIKEIQKKLDENIELCRKKYGDKNKKFIDDNHIIDTEITNSALGFCAVNNDTLFYQISYNPDRKYEDQIYSVIDKNVICKYGSAATPNETLLFYISNTKVVRTKVFDILNLYGYYSLEIKAKSLPIDKIECWNIEGDIHTTEKMSNRLAGATVGSLMFGGILGAAAGYALAGRQTETTDKRQIVFYVRSDSGELIKETIAYASNSLEEFHKLQKLLRKWLPNKQYKYEMFSDDVVRNYKTEKISQKGKDANSNVTDNITYQASSADEIKKYKELLDQGIITQEEFDAKKKQLLGL